ncbi:MAG: hypothetical protein IJI60_04050 [Bacilli bacterium]|nr:hypothetical protein [Bacilli bacterium]
MNNEVEVKAEKIYRGKLFRKIVKIAFLLLLILISIIYLILYIVYGGGRFTITLDKNLSNRKNVFLSESGKESDKTRLLSAGTIHYMDNISESWIPDNIGEEAVGAHNGDNYIAYTFYIINAGTETVHYWYEIDIDDIILNVDEAIRVMVIRNGEKTVYAKESKVTKEAEPNTTKFVSNSIAVLEQRKDFKPKKKDRFTIVVWIEGDDPECKNELLGGEIKMHMDITEEHVDNNKKKK